MTLGVLVEKIWIHSHHSHAQRKASKFPIRLLFAIFCLVFLRSAGSKAVPITVLQDPTYDSLLRADALDSSLRRDPAGQSALAASAEGFYMCLEKVLIPDETFGGTDCWGWADPRYGTEYAIVGVASGIAFVNTSTMTVADIVAGPTTNCGTSRWRDIKTYKNYCYAVSECSGTRQGMMIMDLSYLPDSVKYIDSYTSTEVTTSHNMSIDTVKGIAYLVESDYSGFHIVSLATPSAPLGVTSVSIGNVHDVYAHNDTVFVAEAGYGSFSIWNVADKMAPIRLTRTTVPNGGFAHNVWPTADRMYMVTTEETPDKTVKMWDISNLENVQLVGEYLAPSNLVHNVHIERGMAFISHYESGIVVLDISNPAALTELARYDTYTESESARFRGAWGVYPHTPSGRVYGSNIDGRLFIFSTRSGVPEDTLVVSQVSGIPGQDVAVDISITNTEPLRHILIPISWQGPYDLILDSISTVGLRTAAFEVVDLPGMDNANSRAAIRLMNSFSENAPPLPPGSGSVVKVFFRIPFEASGPANPVVIMPYESVVTFSPELSSGCFTYPVSAKNGSVSVDPQACCIGNRGNVNGSFNQVVDFSDLANLAHFLSSDDPPPLECYDEANLDGRGIVDLTDLSLLVAYLTGGVEFPVPPCSPGVSD